MSSDDKTPDNIVAVPVELLKRMAMNIPSGPVRAEAIALIPKPKPRLVAVELKEFRRIREDYGIDRALEYMNVDQPDLLTVLDGVIDRTVRDLGLSVFCAKVFKDRTRTALGVSDAE